MGHEKQPERRSLVQPSDDQVTNHYNCYDAGELGRDAEEEVSARLPPFHQSLVHFYALWIVLENLQRRQAKREHASEDGLSPVRRWHDTAD